MTEQYLAAGIGTPSQYVTIYSGMNVYAFLQTKPDPKLRASLGLSDSDLVVGKVARLFRLKGHKFLFEAAPRIVNAVPNMKFLLVGDGIYRENFERLARQMGLRDRFVFVGLVPPNEIPRYMALMDVLVHLSLREGLPRTLPQALASGKPVVAFDVDGAREVCLDGQTGFLIRAEDSIALADAVIQLLQDKALATRMGEQGRELMKERFAEELMVQKIDELYRRLAAETRSTKLEIRDRHE
jgi:glycosyltransferase involved in cell wall biosynthesis